MSFAHADFFFFVFIDWVVNGRRYLYWLSHLLSLFILWIYALVVETALYSFSLLYVFCFLLSLCLWPGFLPKSVWFDEVLGLMDLCKCVMCALWVYALCVLPEHLTSGDITLAVVARASMHLYSTRCGMRRKTTPGINSHLCWYSAENTWKIL